MKRTHALTLLLTHSFNQSLTQVDASIFDAVSRGRGVSIDELYEIQSGMQRERRRDVTMREVIEDAQMRSDANDQSVSNVAKHVATRRSASGHPVPIRSCNTRRASCSVPKESTVPTQCPPSAHYSAHYSAHLVFVVYLCKRGENKEPISI